MVLNLAPVLSADRRALEIFKLDRRQWTGEQDLRCSVYSGRSVDKHSIYCCYFGKTIKKKILITPTLLAMPSKTISQMWSAASLRIGIGVHLAIQDFHYPPLYSTFESFVRDFDIVNSNVQKLGKSTASSAEQYLRKSGCFDVASVVV